MRPSTTPRGTIMRCSICGAEIAVLARRHGQFVPHCCNKEMTPVRRRAYFMICPVCGSEVAVLAGPGDNFTPRCCNTDMKREAA